MKEKLGFVENPNLKQIVEELFETMDICSSHFTNVFRILEKYFS